MTKSRYHELKASLSKGSGASSLLRKYRVGGLTPAQLNGVSMAGTLGAGLLDKATTSTSTDVNGVEYQTQDAGSAALSGAMKGASMGAALGPWGALAGGVVYGAYGAITANKQNKEVEAKKATALNEANINAEKLGQDNLTAARAMGFNSKGGYSSIYRKGGYISKYPEGGAIPNPEYEVEGEEVVQGHDTQLEGQEQLASDMHKAVGPTHENGGVMGAGGERVFSDRISVSPTLISILSAAKIPVKKNATYASVAEKLGKLKGKYEEKSKSHSSLATRTGKVMNERIDSFIELTFQDQEFSKQEDDMKKTYAMGGKLPKYYTGVDLEEELGGNPNKRYLSKTPNYTITSKSPNLTSLGEVSDFTPPTSLKDKALDLTVVKPSGNNSNSTSAGKDTFANDFFTGDQAINLGVYMANLNNAGKRKTGYNREVARPSYMRRNNMLPYNANQIKSEANVVNKGIDRTSGNVQDVFARKAAVYANTTEAINNATAQQMAADNQVYNMNLGLSNDYRNRKAAAKNADTEDRVINENAIMTNKQNATNAWLSGVMGNLASKRSYDVEQAKIDIARMDGNRGTALRSDVQLNEMLDKMGYVKKQNKAKGGYIKRKGGYK